ncbi:hypothetical protein ACMFWY_04180 [Roseiconus sp. JC912]|uniref:hypothetical protein n=1 Tax=Roseiconus sp. JC912 TaxID=3396307 RepID=UPI003A4C6E1F
MDYKLVTLHHEISIAGMSEKFKEFEVRLRRMLLDCCGERCECSFDENDLPRTGLQDVVDWIVQNRRCCEEKREVMVNYCLFNQFFDIEQEFLPKHLNAILLRCAYLEFVNLKDKVAATSVPKPF